MVLQWPGTLLEEAKEEDIEISFLELSNIIITLNSGMITNMRNYCDEDEFEDVASS